MNYGVIEDRDREVITRALNMAAIDEEAAALVLEAMIVKKDAAMRDLLNENNLLRDTLRRIELEGKSHAHLKLLYRVYTAEQ